MDLLNLLIINKFISKIIKINNNKYSFIKSNLQKLTKSVQNKNYLLNLKFKISYKNSKKKFKILSSNNSK
jgi:hypothetical protein